MANSQVLRWSAAVPLGLLWLVWIACDGDQRLDPRPNVLLVTIDTLRADHLGSYGFELGSSPSLDSLAANGVVFERAIAAAPATVPSHASILTSRYVREHAIGFSNGATRLREERTLAQHFRDAGYATAAFVSNPVLHPRTALDRGFEVYDAELPSRVRNRPRLPERTADLTTARALTWLEAPHDRPVFLWVHYQDPHGPYTPPAPLERRFRVQPQPGEKPLPVLDDDTGQNGIPSYQALEGVFLPSEYQGRYVGEIFFADRFLGELVTALEGHPSSRESVVLVTADHGESFGENGRWLVHFFTTTPDLAHVPLILRAPDLAPGRRDDVVSHVDILPTLLELAGLDPAPDASGIALGPYLRSGELLPDRSVYCDIGRELSAYRSDGFLRARSAAGAWGIEPRDGEPPQPSWTRYAWQPDGRAVQLPELGSVDDDVLAHIGRAVPIQPAPQTEEALEALRALGYTE